MLTAGTAELADVVRRGLTTAEKRLPPYLFYDEEGSRLFEQITTLPEYYPTRTERRIFTDHASEIVLAATRAAQATGPASVLELGAGTATKTQILLAALTRLQGRTSYFAADLAGGAVHEAARRIGREERLVTVRPIVLPHAAALELAAETDGALIVLFIGSSIGNYEDDEAIELLTGVRVALGARGALVLGTDLRKSPEVLIAAYDDARGVTAAFDKNVLTRLNRELGATFDLDAFRHRAIWNDAASRIEMHLESVRAQTVSIAALGLDVGFREGETIHTESSHKYDDARVDGLLAAAGLARTATFTDERRWFAVHVAAGC